MKDRCEWAAGEEVGPGGEGDHHEPEAEEKVAVDGQERSAKGGRNEQVKGEPATTNTRESRPYRYQPLKLKCSQSVFRLTRASSQSPTLHPRYSLGRRLLKSNSKIGHPTIFLYGNDLHFAALWNVRLRNVPPTHGFTPKANDDATN